MSCKTVDSKVMLLPDQLKHLFSVCLPARFHTTLFDKAPEKIQIKLIPKKLLGISL